MVDSMITQIEKRRIHAFPKGYKCKVQTTLAKILNFMSMIPFHTMITAMLSKRDLVWFDGISTIVGYLMPNPFLYI